MVFRIEIIQVFDGIIWNWILKSSSTLEYFFIRSFGYSKIKFRIQHFNAEADKYPEDEEAQLEESRTAIDLISEVKAQVTRANNKSQLQALISEHRGNYGTPKKKRRC